MSAVQYEKEDVKDRKTSIQRALYYATVKNKVPKIVRQLSLGADVNYRYSRDMTPLNLAASRSRNDSHFQAIELLLYNGADVNTQESELGKTPLHYLADNNNFETIQLCLKYQPDVNIKNNHGNIALFGAISDNELKVVQQFLNHGCDVNSVSSGGWTPMHVAASFAHLEIVRALLKNGADVNALDSAGYTSLMNMLKRNYVYQKYESKLDFLIKYSDVNAGDPSNVVHFCTNFFSNNIETHIILKHVAKIRALGLKINPKILEAISNHKSYKEYFKKCEEELITAKSTKLEMCWVTYFNLLVDHKRKLKNDAGNTDLVKSFKESGHLVKFPIYGESMKKNMEKGIERRRMFDRSCEVLSNKLYVFNPTHLVIRDVLDCLTLKDYNSLVSKV